jgi:hypothetical protein
MHAFIPWQRRGCDPFLWYVFISIASCAHPHPVPHSKLSFKETGLAQIAWGAHPLLILSLSPKPKVSPAVLYAATGPFDLTVSFQAAYPVAYFDVFTIKRSLLFQNDNQFGEYRGSLIYHLQTITPPWYFPVAGNLAN